MSAFSTGIYKGARKINTNIGTPATEWTTKSTSGTAGTAVGFVVQGKLGSFVAPGAQDVAGPVQPFQWYFVKTSGTVDVGYQLTYGGYTFSVSSLAVPGQSTYELSLQDQP